MPGNIINTIYVGPRFLVMNFLFWLSMVTAIVPVIIVVNGEQCENGYWAATDGCCPIILDGNDYYRSTTTYCYPVLVGEYVYYANSYGCYPYSNGEYPTTSVNCTTRCTPECLLSNGTMMEGNHTIQSPSPSASFVSSFLSPSTLPSSVTPTPTMISLSPSPSTSPVIIVSASPYPTVTPSNINSTPSRTASPSPPKSLGVSPSTSHSITPTSIPQYSSTTIIMPASPEPSLYPSYSPIWMPTPTTITGGVEHSESNIITSIGAYNEYYTTMMVLIIGSITQLVFFII